MILKEIIYPKVKNGDKVLLMFDYDGTLTPIVDKPDLAKLDPEVKTALETIADATFVKVAIISGRNISVLKKLSGLTSKDISLFGLHGGEALIDGKICDYSSKAKKIKIQQICKILKNELELFNGIIIENKEYSVSVHYRLAEENTVEKILEIVSN
nr:trehalose-phosphatase [Candidatus Gastranaerophilales bacterium]